MIIVGLPYAFPGLINMDEITGGSPYGASTLAKADGSRQPSANELDGARYQGKHVAQIAAKLADRHSPPGAGDGWLGWLGAVKQTGWLRRHSNLCIRNLCPAGFTAVVPCGVWQIVHALAGSRARSAATLVGPIGHDSRCEVRILSPQPASPVSTPEAEGRSGEN
jgi:hypothetical protein